MTFLKKKGPKWFLILKEQLGCVRSGEEHVGPLTLSLSGAQCQKVNSSDTTYHTNCFLLQQAVNDMHATFNKVNITVVATKTFRGVGNDLRVKMLELNVSTVYLDTPPPHSCFLAIHVMASDLTGALALPASIFAFNVPFSQGIHKKKCTACRALTAAWQHPDMTSTDPLLLVHAGYWIKKIRTCFEAVLAEVISTTIFFSVKGP